MIKLKNLIKMGWLFVFLLSLSPLFLGCPTKVITEYKIVFDSSKIKANYMIDKNTVGNAIKSGDIVKIEDYIRFEAINVGKNKVVDIWKFGSHKIKAAGFLNQRYLTVGAKYALGNTINVDFEAKVAKKYKITFDNTQLKLIKYNDFNEGTDDSMGISSGDSVKEGDFLEFALKDNNASEKYWIIGKNISNGKSNNWWFVAIDKFAIDDDGGEVDGVINVENRDFQSCTLNFDKTMFEVRKKNSNGTILNSGASVNEGDPLYIKVLPNTLNNQVFDYWKFGKAKIKNEYMDNALYNFKLTKNMEDSGAISIGIDQLRAPKEYTIEFGSNILCKIKNYGEDDYKEIKSGTKVTEGARLYMKVKNLNGKVVDNWLLGKMGWYNKDHPNNLWRNIASDYVIDGKLSINYTVKSAKKYTLKYDDTNFIVEYYDYNEDKWKKIKPNSRIWEGLMFLISGNADMTINKWKIKDKTYTAYKKDYDDNGTPHFYHYHWFYAVDNVADKNGIIEITYE